MKSLGSMLKLKPQIQDNQKQAADLPPGAKIMFVRMDGPKGRGVICTSPIKKGELVEFAPVIPMPKRDIIPDSVPDHYVLCWNADTPEEMYCLVGGMVMMYNHSAKHANVTLDEDKPHMAVRVTALRDIEPGEEILWNYDCDLWFDPKE